MYLILDGDKPIGEASIDTNFPHLVKDKGETAWISIVIGDKSYWGKGVAQKAMEFLEEESKRFGLNRIELGVFGFNQRAKAFYKKLGFNEIKLNEMFTFHNGKWHVDIRMEKYL